MGTWKISEIEKIPKLKDPVFIEGLPGIGNVGKVAVDFILDELKAKKIYEVTSYTLPHSVFVNEDNLIELPTIEIYHSKLKDRDLLILAGDVQPVDEESSYEFSDKMLDIAEKFGVKEIITLGGIGLAEAPKEPKVYCTGNDKKIIEQYKKDAKIKHDLYGVVGPIVGVTGLMVGLSKKRKIPAVSLLAETYGHPLYLGVRGAREVLKILKNKLDLDLDLKELDKEIEKIEGEIKDKGKISKASKKAALDKLGKKATEMDYIG